MRILVSNNHLNTLGGSETFTYTLAVELKRLGHTVDILTAQPGYVSEKLAKEEGLEVNKIKPTYDLCLLNHNTTVKWVLENLTSQPKEKIVQTCHGTIPQLEQPYGDPEIKYVGISQEVLDHLKTRGIRNATLIHNGIDLTRFAATEDVPFERIFSLSQSDYFNNNILTNVAKELGVELVCNNKHTNPIWEMEDQIRNSQLVFGLGRSAYEGLAMGKAVFVADARNYMGGKMDGIITKDTLPKYLYNNCSGRATNTVPTVGTILKEIENNITNVDSRALAEEYFDIRKQAQKYLNL